MLNLQLSSLLDSLLQRSAYEDEVSPPIHHLLSLLCVLVNLLVEYLSGQYLTCMYDGLRELCSI